MIDRETGVEPDASMIEQIDLVAGRFVIGQAYVIRKSGEPDRLACISPNPAPSQHSAGGRCDNLG
jgi:hypothetical protein